MGFKAAVAVWNGIGFCDKSWMMTARLAERTAAVVEQEGWWQ